MVSCCLLCISVMVKMGCLVKLFGFYFGFLYLLKVKDSSCVSLCRLCVMLLLKLMWYCSCRLFRCCLLVGMLGVWMLGC